MMDVSLLSQPPRRRGDHRGLLREVGGLSNRVARAISRAFGARVASDCLIASDRFQTLVERAPDVITIVSRDGTILYGSPASRQVVGFDPADLVGRNASELIHPEDVTMVTDALQQAFVSTQEVSVTYRFRHADGTWCYLDSILITMLDDPTVGGVVVHSRDVTDLRLAGELHRELEIRYRTVVEQVPAIIYIEADDEVNTPLYYSPQGEAILGFAFEDFVENPMLWESLIHPDDRDRVMAENERTNETGERFSVEYRHRTITGEYVWIRDEAVLVRDDDGRSRFWQGVKFDISDQKRLQDQLVHTAFHDALTGLPNRLLFMDRVRHALARASRRGDQVALLFLDLDDFKVVNDSLGHEVGDDLLVKLGERLVERVRPGDTVARLGGDEFTVLLEDLHTSAEATVVAERVAEGLRDPFLIAGREFFVTASIGISMLQSFDDDPADLLRHADMAMYAAKRAGKARFRLYEPRMDEHALTRLQLETDLRRALERGELSVAYQPVVALEDGEIREVEALARWTHPEQGQVSPSRFIPVAEETGLILLIGTRVLEQACMDLQRWYRMYGTSPTLSVNLSARQFQQPALAREIAELLARYDVDPRNVKLEITESVAMVDADATMATLNELKALGLTLAIDDFGTGYSSLGYLKRFPVDVLKIDRSFVAGLGSDADDTAIVRSVVAVAKALNLSVTAEGIETLEQADTLRSLECDRGQGYFFAAPMPAEDVERLVFGEG